MGPRTVPWGTPDNTGALSEVAPSRTTLWDLEERKSVIQSRHSFDNFATAYQSNHATALITLQQVAE